MIDVEVFARSLVEGGLIIGGGLYTFFWFIGYLINSSISVFEYITKK